MKAVIRRGKRAGEVIEVGQWCNDWFSDQDSTAIFSPTSLAFSHKGMNTVEGHKNNGTLFKEFHTIGINRNSYPAEKFGEHFEYSFRRTR